MLASEHETELMGKQVAKGKKHALPTSCTAATRREKRGRKPRRVRVKWEEGVYGGVPYAHAGGFWLVGWSDGEE